MEKNNIAVTKQNGDLRAKLEEWQTWYDWESGEGYTEDEKAPSVPVTEESEAARDAREIARSMSRVRTSSPAVTFDAA